MIKIKMYKERLYYVNKWGTPEYIETKEDNVLVEAAILTGKGLKKEEVLVYEAYGETVQDAELSANNFLKANPNFKISRKETVENE